MKKEFLEIVDTIKRNESQGIYFKAEELKEILNVSLDELIDNSDYYEYEYYSKIHQYVYYITYNDITIHII